MRKLSKQKILLPRTQIKNKFWFNQSDLDAGNFLDSNSSRDSGTANRSIGRAVHNRMGNYLAIEG